MELVELAGQAAMEELEELVVLVDLEVLVEDIIINQVS